jgi:hypothetical protein
MFYRTKSIRELSDQYKGVTDNNTHGIQKSIINEMKNNSIYDKKQLVLKSPDLNKMQVVIIDHRTKIYIARDADPEEARARYLSRRGQAKS